MTNTVAERLSAFGALLAILATAGSAAAAAAEKSIAYPSRPIRFILGYPPGGSSDATARLLAAPLPARLGQPVVVDNRGGAGGNIAAELAARATPDGHTWFLGNNAILATNQALYEKLPFDALKDFATVVLIGQQPNVLVVHPALPVKSVSDLVALAKAKPGQLNYASTGTGTVGHLAGELFKTLVGVNFVHIPYKGGGPAVIDVLSGQVQFMFATAASVIPHVKSGRLRALAVTTPARSATLPELPTIAESGVPGFDATTWHGIVVPAATPSAVIARINSEINAVIATPETRDRLVAQGIEPRGGTPQQFAAYLRTEIPKWTKVVRASGAKPE
jgi:tripartite-type tricarboxylate transporter receptor subunit TctC